MSPSLLFVLFLSVAKLKADGDMCIIVTLNHATLDNSVKSGDEVSSGTLYPVLCVNGYQLDSKTFTDVACITDQIPSSCREVSVITSSNEFVKGSEVKLTCQITSDDKVTGVRWLKDGIDFRIQGDFQLDQSSPYEGTVAFTSTPADAGSYKCEATIDSPAPFDKEEALKGATISILSTTMSPEEGIVYLEIGESFPLSCTFPNIATYMLKISWLRDADASGCSKTHGDEYVPSDDSLCKITVMSNDNQGAVTVSRPTIEAKSSPVFSNNYMCIGVYKNLDTDVELEVTDSKRVEIRGFTTQPRAMQLGVGDDASFTCETVGEVQGTVQWLVDSIPQTSSLYTIVYTPSSRATTSVLSLDALQKRDSSVVCKFQYGADVLESDQVALAVYSIGFVTTPEDSGFKAGDDYEMTCSVRTEIGIVPSISWYKDDASVGTQKYSTISNSDKTMYTSVLYFPDVWTTEMGVYRCKLEFTVDSKPTTHISDPVSVYVRVVTLLPVEDYHVSSQTSDSKEFTCLYQGDSEPGIGVTAASWWVNGVDVKDVDDFVINNDLFTETAYWKTILKMSNMSPKMAGTVECRYECGIGGSISEETMLYVHRQIPLPAETKTASNTYTITCSSHTNEAAIVTWTKGDTFIGQNDANFSPMPGETEDYVQTNTLVISDWSASKDTTAITCKYLYDISRVKYSTSTELIFKGFTGSPGTYTYYAPSSKSLYCSFGFSYSNVSPIEAQWFKDGENLDENQRFESKTQKQSGNWQTSLKILGDGQGGTEDDSGVYTCTFVFSDEEKYEDISNIYFYTIQVLPAESDFYDEASIQLSCVLTSKGLSISEVEWMKDGKEVEEPAFTKEVQDNTATLTLSQIIPEYSGTYTCLFNVPGGKKLKETKSVEIRNIVMLSPEYIKLTRGDSINLSCSVKYFSTTDKLAWYKDKTLVGGGSASNQAPVLTSTLKISSVQSEHLGEYRCGVGDSRSKRSATVSATEILQEDDLLLKGERATVKCTISKLSSQPSQVYWKDSTDNEYKSSDSSDKYTVTESAFSGGEQSISLEITSVVISTEFYCYFVVDEHPSMRKATITVLEIYTTPALAYKGSTAKVRCRIVNSPTEPTVSWSGSPEGTESQEAFSPGDGSLTASLDLAAVENDQTLTCTFSVDGNNFQKTVQVEVYEVTVPDTHLIERESGLSVQLQVTPEMIDTSAIIKSLSVTQDSTVNGDAQISALTVSYASVVGPMEVTYSFLDIASISRSLTSNVHVTELRQPLVGLSDGSTAAKLTCVMYGVLTDDMKKGISAFWMENGKKSFHTPTFTGDEISSEHTIQVSSDTTDTDIPCGFTYQGRDFTHLAKLNVVEIECSKEVEIDGDSNNTTLFCKISGGSASIGPVRAIWYRGGDEQIMIQDLADAGWPSPVTTYSGEVTEAGTYRCFIDFGVAEFSKSITVTKEASNPIDPIKPKDPDDDESSMNLPLTIGIAVPVIIICVIITVFLICYMKKTRGSKSSYNVRSLTTHSTAFNRPPTLVYHNEMHRDSPPLSRPSQDVSKASNYIASPVYNSIYDEVLPPNSISFVNNAAGRKDAPPRPLPPVSSRQARPSPPSESRPSIPDKPSNSVSYVNNAAGRKDAPPRPLTGDSGRGAPPSPPSESRPSSPDKPARPERPTGTYTGFDAANYSRNMVPKPPSKTKMDLNSLSTSEA